MLHPEQNSDALLMTFLNKYCVPGAFVLHTFAGSLSTAQAFSRYHCIITALSPTIKTHASTSVCGHLLNCMQKRRLYPFSDINVDDHLRLASHFYIADILITYVWFKKTWNVPQNFPVVQTSPRKAFTSSLNATATSPSTIRYIILHTSAGLQTVLYDSTKEHMTSYLYRKCLQKVWS